MRFLLRLMRHEGYSYDVNVFDENCVCNDPADPWSAGRFSARAGSPFRPDPSFEPGPLAQSRLTRAQLLRLTGLNDFAEGELKFGARNDGEQENVYAFELAKFAAA